MDPVIKGHGVMHLDGDFRRESSDHTQHSYRVEGKWFVVRRGPRYRNVYEVTAFDETGERWLQEHEEKDAQPVGGGIADG